MIVLVIQWLGDVGGFCNTGDIQRTWVYVCTCVYSWVAIEGEIGYYAEYLSIYRSARVGPS